VDPLRQSSHSRFAVTGPEAPGALRRYVRDQAIAVGAGQEVCARAQLVATELATNLLQHAVPGGCVLTRLLPGGSFELIAIDSGPGIADPSAAIAGHGPAAHGLGCGLAAVQRASARFGLHSVPGKGTIVLSVIDLRPAGRGEGAPTRRNVAGVSVGVNGPCGDAWAVTQSDGELAVAVADGLGHGAAASVAANVTIAQFGATPADPSGIIRRANAAMRETRGAALTVCRLLPGLGLLEYVAVGNVNGCVLTASARASLVTHPGTVGLRTSPPPAKLRTSPWAAGSTLVLWSDGLNSPTGALAADTGLLQHDPAVIAAVMYRDHGRGTDDATVVVVQNPGAP
jgi:anti-sigma regulatory factor (Ser/Thr protein kinase)